MSAVALTVAELVVGATNTLTISYDTTKDGKHALDYLTDYDRTESVNNNPCSGVAGCNLVSENTFPIPLDPDVTKGKDQILGNADDITQIPGSFSIFGGTITGVSAYTLDGPYTGDSTRFITITFTSDVVNPVMAWGGHIATRLNWGINKSANADSAGRIVGFFAEEGTESCQQRAPKGTGSSARLEST